MVKQDTPSINPYFPNDFANALESLDTFFNSHNYVTELTIDELSEYKNFLKGWAIETPFKFNDNFLIMHFLIDPSFPHSLPRIALKNPNLYLKWTHIENDQGLLCLGSTLPFRNDDIALLAQETIREAFNYIKEGIESNSHQDFTEDLLTYWAREEKKSPRSISLLSKLNECHAIEVFNFNNHYYFVDDQDQLVSWLKNKHASSIHLSQSINSHLFCITQKLVPAKFPSTIVQLIDLLAEEGISYKVILEKKIKAFIESKVSKELPILLSFQYTDNWILVGCLIKKNSGKINGFRDESKHKIILKNPSYFQRIVPDRADYAWIHKRNDLNIENLSQKSIAILGCGSLGSGIAKLLLQAGLKQLTLVDPETLSWGNISRHELGANDVGYSKVKGMERHLGSFYPYAEIQAVPSSWEEIDDKNNFFDKNDLVISTIGNWASERALNKYAINNNVRIPIIYSWLESHACVGHSVVIGSPSIK
jgi:hypothetical protein